MKKWLCCLLVAGCMAVSSKIAWAAELDMLEAETLPAEISTEIVEIAAPAEPLTFYTTANLNLREAPTTESTLLLTVPRGTAVMVTDLRDLEWYKVVYEGRNGYMKSEFLSERPDSAPSSETSSDAEATQPAVYADTGIGTVELLDWSDAKKIFTIGTPAQVIDVRTKITYYVASFSNGQHADVEPVTADDTAAMKRTYGGTWSWDTRPVIVIINNRTLAASINGMPHGGGINGSNDMNGQVCIHFRGSKTHNGNKKHEADHQDSVTEAFNTAKNW